MSKNPNFKANDDGDKEEDDDDVDDLRGGEGGEGGVPFSWSFRDKGPNPPLCFAK